MKISKMDMTHVGKQWFSAIMKYKRKILWNKTIQEF